MKEPKLEWGPKALRAFVNNVLIPWCRSGRPLRSTTCEIDERPDGTLILPAAGGVAGSVAGTHPFLVVNASDDEGAKVRIYSGRINALDAVTDGPFSVGDNPPLILEVADGDRVYVDITTGFSAGAWSDSAFDVAAGATTPSATATHAYYPLCDVTVADDAVTSIGGGVAGNIGHRRCGTATVYNDQYGAGA